MVLGLFLSHFVKLVVNTFVLIFHQYNLTTVKFAIYGN